MEAHRGFEKNSDKYRHEKKKLRAATDFWL